jgi:prephenate dehydrogenase
MITVGIIGYGNFGSFLTRKLADYAEVKVFEPYLDVPTELSADMHTICQCDYIILAIPVDSYEEVLTEIARIRKDTSIIVDVSSVKMVPTEKLDQLLPGVPRVIIHPLFGPQSAEESFDGHVVVMCPDVSDTTAYASIKSFIMSLGLRVIEKSPQEHDREMALAQGLTFYLARALLRMQIHDVELVTPSFKKLLDLAELESHHTEDLFRTIQLNNPYTTEIRVKFIDVISELNKELS